MLAARLGLSTSPVLLAAFAVALTPLTSLASGQPVVVQLVVSNRFRPGFAGSVSPVAQSLPLPDRGAGTPRSRRWRVRTWQSALVAYKHAYYDPAGKDEVSKRITAERGSERTWAWSSTTAGCAAASSPTPSPADAATPGEPPLCGTS